MSSTPAKYSLSTEPLLLRVPEAAKVLAISPRKLWELTNCGDIPCVRIGRAVRYDPRDLRDWIAHRRGGDR